VSGAKRSPIVAAVSGPIVESANDEGLRREGEDGSGEGEAAPQEQRQCPEE
jgi:hypothetical protein